MGRWKSWNASHRAALVVAVLAIVVVATGTLGSLGSGPSASPAGTSTTSALPTGTSPTSPPVSPVPVEWADLDVPAIPLVADIVPLSKDDAGIAPDSGFAVESLNGESALAIAARVKVDPVTRLVPSGDASHAFLRPASALTAGSTYRLTLRGPDQALQGSWVYRVRSSVRVVSTIPANRATGVPTEMGIELTFDQGGVAAMGDRFSISPKVNGRFERHGRTQVFVPDSLAPQTLYTVTLKAGLPRTGTDLKLEKDFVFRFETEGETTEQAVVRFGREAFETAPGQAPVLGIDVSTPESVEPPTSVRIVVRRFPDEASAASALTAFLAAPRWTQHSYPLLPTKDLPTVATFTATPDVLSGSYRLLRFPEALPVGWYAVEIVGPPAAHAFLQVTAVSAWTAVLTDRTVVWVNDVEQGRAIEGATVSMLGGSPFATSDGRGIANAATPRALIPAAAAPGSSSAADTRTPLLVVRAPGRGSVLVPFQVEFSSWLYRGEWWEEYGAADGTYWSLLYTDRSLYRRSDRIEAWGYIRGRDGGNVPENVTLRLFESTGTTETGAALVTTTVSTTPSGAFVGGLSFDRLPYGAYALVASAGDRVVATHQIMVGAVRKPLYRLTVRADHSAVVTGSAVRLTATASFFDGSPVVGVPLKVWSNGEGDTIQPMPPTDAAGSTSTIIRPNTRSDVYHGEHWEEWAASVSPMGPEEGEIYAETSVAVFPSKLDVTGTATLDGATLGASGTVVEVDIARIDRERAAGTWPGIVYGKPVAGRAVHAEVTRLISVRTQVGTYYDYIRKVATPRYEYTTEERGLPSVVLTSDSAGKISLSTAVPSQKDRYRVSFTTSDVDGRSALERVVAGTVAAAWAEDPAMHFETGAGKLPDEVRYAVGDRVSWRMVEGTKPVPDIATDRFMYIVAQRGLVDVTTSEVPRFDRTFAGSDAPGIFIIGVRFVGWTYAPKAAEWASFDVDSRALKVSVTADRKSYRPGEDATITVRTTDTAGRPRPADVVVQAVDEKLFAMGAAGVPYAAESLYRKVDSGIVRLTSTHQVPARGPEGEGGDTAGGGGDRADFRDTLVSRLVSTGSDGTATLKVHLSDDLTSWHFLATGMTARVEAGVGELLVAVSLPLFADVGLADEYVAGDRPTVRLRAFGSALASGDPVVFTVSAPSLGVTAREIRATAFGDAWLELPALPVGRYDLRVAVASPTHADAAGKPLGDALVRPLVVVASRVTAVATWYGAAEETVPRIDAAGLATYTFTDGGAGRYLTSLVDASQPASARIDDAIAQEAAIGLLVGRFGFDPSTLPSPTLDLDSFHVQVANDGDPSGMNGLNIVPFAGSDPWVATRIAMLSPGTFDRSTMRELLINLRDDPAPTRDLVIESLAGLGALGEPVDADLHDALAASDLTPAERIDLAIAFLRAGDESTARTLERALLEDYGQRLGPWVRLNLPAGTDGPADVAHATALVAVLAAGLGDPLTPDLLAYVAANPSRETSDALETVVAIGLALERLAVATPRFAYVVDGVRREVSIDPSGSVRLVLTTAQAASLDVEVLSGSVGLAVTWPRAVDVATVPTDHTVALERVEPSGPVVPDAIVDVVLRPAFKPGALASDCYVVVEQAPTGLAPIEGPWAGDDRMIGPSSIVGQEVRFCVPHGVPYADGRPLHYKARVVNAGSFVWEPATIQHPLVASAFAATGSTRVSIASR